MLRTILPATLLASTALALDASPAQARPFGEKGQYIVTTDAALDYQRDTIRIEGAEDETRTRYSFHVAGDYTSFHRITFGMDFGVDGEVSGIEGFDTVKTFRFGGRAGYVLPLGSAASLWLRGGLSFGNGTFQSQLQQYTVRGTRLTLSAPFMFNPYPQVLIGVGPTFDHDLTAKAGSAIEAPKVTGFGVHMTLGFWFE